MSEFVLATSTASEWRVAVDQCLAQVEGIASDANLGFVYVTDHLAPHFPAITQALREGTSVAHWIGSVGIGVCATRAEIFDAPGVVVLLGGFAPDSFCVFASQAAALEDLGADVTRFVSERRPGFGVVHADPRNSHLVPMVERLSGLADSVFMVGGLASSRRECPQLADTVVQGGLSGALFTSDVAVATRLSQGCSPISARHEITRAQRNLIFELDGRPALEVLSEAAGELLMRNPRELGGRIFAGFPIAGTDTGDYLVRNLVGLDMDAGVVAVGELVTAGQQLVFCRRDADSAREDLLRMVRELANGASAPPRAALYFSCLARGPNLFGPNSAELNLIADALGEVPLAGFFANGEISNHRLYAYTGVLTLFY